MSGFPIEVATRIKTLPPYLFAAIDKMKQAAIAKGVDIINLGIGDPDLPTPTPIVESLGKAAKDPKHHQYIMQQRNDGTGTVTPWFRHLAEREPDVEQDTDRRRGRPAPTG